MRYLVWLVALIPLMLCAQRSGEGPRSAPAGLREALDALKVEMANAPRYRDVRSRGISDLKRRLPRASRRDSVTLCLELARSYDAFNIDSCIWYYEKGAEVARRDGQELLACKMDAQRFSRLPIIGAIPQAIDGFEKLDTVFKNPADRFEYFEAANRMTLFIADMYPNSAMRDSYLEISADIADSLLSMVPPEKASLRRLLAAEVKAMHGDEVELVALLTDLLDHLDIDDNFYGRAAATLAAHYQTVDNQELAAYYYALAALSDIRTGTLEGVAMLRLGALLFDMGDLDQAYLYINNALEQSEASGSKIRSMEAYNVLPRISKAYHHEEQKRLHWLLALGACLVAAVLGLVAALVRKRRHTVRVEAMRERLARANELKDQNMARFLTLTNLYADKLDELIKLVRRQLQAGRIEELNNILRSGTLVTEQTKHFLPLLDDVFVHLYPTFVDELNGLLLPDKRIPVPEGGALNTELRVAAFQRMGVDDAARIARLLGLSVASVYTYRNRTRSRAADRDAFDAALMSLCKES